MARHSFDDSARLRLQAGEAICVNSARSIARLGIELSDRNCLSRLSSGGPQLLACICVGNFVDEESWWEDYGCGP